MKLEDKVKPARRAPVWASVPDDKWNDWRWQLSHRLNSVEELNEVIKLTPSEIKALQTNGLFRVDITPYFASLMDWDNTRRMEGNIPRTSGAWIPRTSRVVTNRKKIVQKI